jgi:S1-C subfamily serine protease
MRLASLGIQVGLLVSAFGVGLFCGRQTPAVAAVQERELMAGAAVAAPAAAAPALAAGALAAVAPVSPEEVQAAEAPAERSAAPARSGSKSKEAKESKEPKEREPLSWSRVAARAQSWTAAVRADLNYGAGIVVDRSGLIVTNHHVVANTRSVTVTPFGGSPSKAEVLDSDATLDLALLRVELSEPLAQAATVGSAAGLGVGDDVLAVGSPRKMFFSVSRGMVSFPERQLDGVSYIQTDLPINEGNSGGPLVDREGRVVGVVSFILKESQGLSFALPIDRALARFAPQLEAARHAAEQGSSAAAAAPRAEGSPDREAQAAQAH